MTTTREIALASGLGSIKAVGEYYQGQSHPSNISGHDIRAFVDAANVLLLDDGTRVAALAIAASVFNQTIRDHGRMMTINSTTDNTADWKATKKERNLYAELMQV